MATQTAIENLGRLVNLGGQRFAFQANIAPPACREIMTQGIGEVANLKCAA